MRQGNHLSDTTEVGRDGLEAAAMAPDFSEHSDSNDVFTPSDFPPSPPPAMSNLGAVKGGQRPASATMDRSSPQSPPTHDRTGNVSTESLGSFEIIPSQSQSNNISTESLETYEVVSSQEGTRSGSRHESGNDEPSRPLTPASNPPTAEDWDNHRAVFTKLYRNEARTLKDVKSIMATRYGFIATERMYKKRVSDWGLRKYSRRGVRRTSSNDSTTQRLIPQESPSPTRRSRRRSSAGTNAASSGQLKTMKRGSLEKDLNSFLLAKDPNLSYTRFLAISQELKNVEVILTQIDDYYSAFTQDMWKRTFPKTARASIKEIPLCFDMSVASKTAATAMVRHPGEVFNRFHMAPELFKMGTSETKDLAWTILNDAFAMVKDILVQQHPQLLRYLFMQFWDQTFDAHPKLRQELFESAASLAELYLAWRRNLDTFESLLGAQHDETLRSKMALTGNLIDADRYDDAQLVLSEIINGYEAGSTAYYNRAALCRRAWLYSLQCRFSEAETGFVEVLDRCKDFGKSQPGGNALDEVYLAATTHLARIQARRNYRQGEKLLQEAFELCTCTMGPDHAYTYTIKNELATLKKTAEATDLLDNLFVSASN